MGSPKHRSLPLLAFVLVALATPAHAGWSHDPRTPASISPEFGVAGTVEAAAPDGNGGAFVFFRDFRANNWDVYALHLLPTGDVDPVWPAEGVPICSAIGDQSNIVAVSDGADGAFVSWLDPRLGTPKNYATRVLASGAIAAGFPADGVLIDAVHVNAQHAPKVVADGVGGMGVAWEYEFGPLNHDIHSGRVAPDGTISWVAVLGGTAADDRNPSMGVHTPGIVSVVWMMAPDVVRIEQRQAVFGTQMAGIGNNSADITTHPKVAPDGWGGTFIAYVGDIAGTPSLRLIRMTPDDIVFYPPVNGAPSETYELVDFVYAGNFRNWLVWSATPGNSLLQTLVTADGGLGGTSVLTSGGLAMTHPVGVLPHTSGSILATFGRVLTSGAVRLTLNGPNLAAFGALPTPDGWVATQRPADVQLAAVCGDGNEGALIFSHDAAVTFDRHSYAMRVDRFGAYDGAPRILSVRDVAGDQGGHVRLAWSASYLDNPPIQGPVDPYRIWRQVPVAFAQERLAAGAAQVTAGEGDALSPGAIRLDEQNGATFAWEYVTSQIAAGFPAYSITLTSVSDSSGSGPANTVYMVEAVMGGGAAHWSSVPDSGHSVDNLPPATPSPFAAALMGGASTHLTWGANTEPDLAGYELHRGASAGFVPDGSTLIATPTGTSHLDAAVGQYYKLAAVDAHGNRSGYALVTPGGTLDTPGDVLPRELALAVVSANPASHGATLRYALPALGIVRVALYDVHGRMVRELFAGDREAGEHVARWDGRESGGALAPSGIYFARLTLGGAQLVRRIVLSH